MRWRSYLLIGVVAYLLFVLIELPAQHVLGWATAGTKQPPFTYGTIKGSLWRGKMEAVTVHGIPVDKLKWRFTPTELIFGNIGFDIIVNHAGQELEGNIAIGSGDQIQIEDISGEIPASMIPPMIDLSQIGVGGNVSLDVQQLTLTKNQITAVEGEIQWLDSSLKGPFALKVGDLKADLSTGQKGEVKARIKDLGGATSVDGELSLTTDGNFQVKGQIKPGTDSDPRLGSALKAISKQQSDGSYRITYSTRL
ncbi:MAG: type II secretion system protein N [Candidatus Thiodiazotropha sp. 6PLUC2]